MSQNKEQAQWHIVAETGDKFTDFAPYVPSLNDADVVAFQAALRDGHTGLFTAHNGEVTQALSSGDERFSLFNSHPDINISGALSFYTGATPGGTGLESVSVWQREQHQIVAGTSGPLSQIGPLGPTMNEAAVVAFRGTTRAGLPGIFTGTPDTLRTLADTKDAFSGFQGLPVIDEQGAVTYRADLKNGTQGIYQETANAEAPRVIVKTGSQFSQLAFFPTCNHKGTIAFSAVEQDGTSGVFICGPDDDMPQKVITGGRYFQSIRGALLDGSERIVFFATPHDGQLGIYTQVDDAPLLAIGRDFLGAKVTGFALNPVSINRRGLLAIRIQLADQRQYIASLYPHP